MPGVVAILIATLCAVVHTQPHPDYPTSDPSLNEYTNLAATLLAEDVKHTYGGDAWTDSLFIAFDFVVYNKKNQEVARYHNEWNRLSDEGMLIGKLSDGRVYQARFTSVGNCLGTMTIDSQEVAAEHLSAALRMACDRLNSNLHWLLTPLRLLDPGIGLELLNDSLIDGKQVTPMKVMFNDSLSSASDVLIYINTSYKNIERWRVNYDGNYREYIWRLTRRIGPYLFATRLWAEDFQTYIQLERIRIKKLPEEETPQGSTEE